MHYALCKSLRRSPLFFVWHNSYEILLNSVTLTVDWIDMTVSFAMFLNSTGKEFWRKIAEVASFPYLSRAARLSTWGMKSDRTTESVKRRAIQLRRKARGAAAVVTGGGGSVLSGRRCFVTFVSSRPACRWRDNQSPPSLGKRKTKRKREKEGSGAEEREGWGCERRSEVKPRGFPTVCMRVASLCRSSGVSEWRNWWSKWCFRVFSSFTLLFGRKRRKQN